MSENLSQQEIADYLSRALEESDPNVFVRALGHVAQVQGMAEVAKASGLTPERLARALSGEGNPSFGTILKVINALGLRLEAHTGSRAAMHA